MSELAINIVGRYAAGGAFGSAEKDLNKVAAAGKSASMSLAGIGASIKNVGTGLTAAVTLPLVGLGLPGALFFTLQRLQRSRSQHEKT